MAFDSDVALIGTGVAPLIAASRLLAEGKSVLLLNPDWDFFQEESELPLDPLLPTLPAILGTERLQRSLRKKVVAALRPDFPGAIEFWPRDAGGASGKGYHDVLAPHVRTRGRLWIHAQDERFPEREKTWEVIEDMYVAAADSGLNPAFLQGSAAMKRFPGASVKAMQTEHCRGVLLPKMSDVDVNRYRLGLLEFVRERAGTDRVVCDAFPLDLIDEGVRFRYERSPRTARIRDGIAVFWTPRLSQWLGARAKQSEIRVPEPTAVRLWEEWSLVSRDPLYPETVGTFEEMVAWAEVEGAPDPANQPLNRLSVLRLGGHLAYKEWRARSAEQGDGRASADSFQALSRLCHDLLRWDKFSIRNMRPRTIFEWDESVTEERGFWLSEKSRVWVCCGADGPLSEIAVSARAACDRLVAREEEGRNEWD